MQAPTKILIVEDEDILARNLQSFLARTVADVRVAADAHQTLKILESFTPEVVILDFNLPDLNGIQIHTFILRRCAPLASCVMISGHLSDSIIHDANDEGIVHVLSKPFSFIELQEVIDKSYNETMSFQVNVKDSSTSAAPVPDKTANGPFYMTEDNMMVADRRRQERRSFSNRRQPTGTLQDCTTTASHYLKKIINYPLDEANGAVLTLDLRGHPDRRAAFDRRQIH